MADSQFGPNPKTVIDFRQLGVSGLRRYSGFVLEDFLPQLLQWRGIDIYREMAMNDPDVGAVLFAIRMLCRRVPWRVEPATNQTFDTDAAEWLDTCFNDMSRPWLDIVDEILINMLPYGHAPMEVTYKRRTGENDNPSMNSKYSDGRVSWRKFEIRHPDTIWKWEFDEEGSIMGLHQLAPPRFLQVFIPIHKLALFRTTANKNNPEGLSVLRNAYRPWYMKKQLENIEAVGVERDLAGLPVAKVPPELLSTNASPEQQALKATLQKIVTNIRRDEQEGILWPHAVDANGNEMYKLELLSTGGSRQFDTDKIINRYRQEIMQTLLADFLLLGHNSAGNRSIVERRSDMFATAVGSFMDIVSEVFNRYMIPRLFRLNPDLQVSDYPVLKHGDLQAADLDAIASYFQKLSATGMPLWPNTELSKYLMEIAKAPTPVDPMKIADDLEVQPRRTAEVTIEEILPETPFQEPTLNTPYADIPVPGIDPSSPFQPYPRTKE